MADEIIGRISVGDGATFTPSVSSSGELSWTNNKNLPNPATVDIPQVVIDRYQLAPTSNPTFTGTVTAEDITASGTITGDVTGTASGNLPLSGGTMTGAIDFASAGNNIKSTNDDGYLVFRGGDADTSASIVLRGNNYTQYNNPGSFSIRATDGNTYTSLEGKSVGTLTWDGANVLTDATVGTMVTKSISSAVSLAQGTAKTITSISLSAGTWLITGHAHWSSTTADKGYSIQITNTANSLQYAYDSAMVVHSANSGHLSLQTCRIWNLTATTTIYLCGYTTVASSVADADIKAVRIV
jgi:hypothetical protein